MLPKLPPFLTQVSGPSYKQDSQSSESYDYSGLDDHLKRQEAVGGLRDAKYASLYAGDVASGVTAGNKIRDLLAKVRVFNPGATERAPGSHVAPLVRVSSRSSGQSSAMDAGSFQGHHGDTGTSVPPYRPQPPQQSQSQARPVLPQSGRRKPAQRTSPLMTDVLGYDRDMSGQV